jgi:hypothetical protein
VWIRSIVYYISLRYERDNILLIFTWLLISVHTVFTFISPCEKLSSSRIYMPDRYIYDDITFIFTAFSRHFAIWKLIHILVDKFSTFYPHIHIYLVAMSVLMLYSGTLIATRYMNLSTIVENLSTPYPHIFIYLAAINVLVSRSSSQHFHTVHTIFTPFRNMKIFIYF